MGENDYPFMWSFNLMINPYSWVRIRIWWKNRWWQWEIKHPLTVRAGGQE